VDYDERRAAGYDRRHAARFAQADESAALLAELAVTAAADDAPGAVPGGARPRALELGIGTGRLALPLARRGVAVTGIDSSAPMLERLRAKPGGGELTVAVGDFADAATLVEGPFELVFVAFNSLFELLSQDDQCRCVGAAATLLVPGGLFVVEALAPELTRLERSLSVIALGADEVVLQATSHDPLTQVVSGHDVVLSEGGGVQLLPWAIRYASVPELDLMARLAGLHLRQRWGGWGGEPFTATSANHVSVYESAGKG
jgi:SAM-dependent methyltransferase